MAGGSKARHPLWVHFALFVATCFTTFLAGAQFHGPFDAMDGVAFSGTLMAILLCHEMGHYVVARRHGIDASLPYFIPLPPMVSLGTMGAVIQMRQPLTDRNQLIDVGAAGPLAGLIVAIPLLYVGLTHSEVQLTQGGMVEGNSLLYIGVKYLAHGTYLPTQDGYDVNLHPIAWASWVGLLLTMINLIPIGQLDGGHIARGFLGNRHERLSGMLHLVMLAIGFAVAMTVGVSAGMPWLVWAALIWGVRRLSGGVYHPAVADESITTGRRWLVLFMLFVFATVFTPVPLREWHP